MKIINFALLLFIFTCTCGQKEKEKIKCANVIECAKEFEQILNTQKIVYTAKIELENNLISYEYHDVYLHQMPGWGYYREENQIEGRS